MSDAFDAKQSLVRSEGTATNGSTGIGGDQPSAQVAIIHCRMPENLTPWVERFYEPVELRMVAWCGENTISQTLLIERMIAARVDAAPADAVARIRRARCRGVLCDTLQDEIQPADFHIRFDFWALFEGWQDLPDEVRWQLNQWEADTYIDKHRQTALDLKAGQPRDPRQVIPEYVLLHEALALIERVPHIYLWPCNCRSMLEKCSQPRLTCLRFDNTRGIGWEISTHRAQAVLMEASRRGLMHSAELGLTSDGNPRGAICNCCSDCCFPHLLAEREAAAGHWPISRYEARLDPQVCNGCGRCARRCPFDAIQMRRGPDPDQPSLARVDAARCRGCGVCAVGCRQTAIEMVKLRGSIFEDWYRPLPKPPV